MSGGGRGGDEADPKIFYTALYHAHVAPMRDVDMAVHQLPKGANDYSTYSLCDPTAPSIRCSA